MPDRIVAPKLTTIRDVPVGPRPVPNALWARRLRDLWIAGPGGPPERFDAARARQALIRAVQKSRTRYDVIIVEQAGLAPIVGHRGLGRHWALTLHNIASVRAQQRAAVEPGRRQRLLVRREVNAASRLEAWCSRQFDLVCTTSELDASHFAGDSVVVPNGVDLDAFRPTPIPRDPVVVLTASLGYQPNVDGAEWFVREVWPVIRRRVPDARLDLVGRSPTEGVVRLSAEPGVLLHADVPDVRPFLEAARVAVVPLRVGSGTRLKALEAMASGRPLVGTSIGLEGLHVEPGDVRQADDPATFAQAVVSLLTDDDVAQSLADRARRVVEDGYSWTEIGQRFASAIAELAAQPSRRGARSDED